MKPLDYLMKLLAMRDHSEKELLQKLKKKFEDDIDGILKAIQYAKDHQWLKTPEELSQIVARQLSQRKKGSQYILKYLKQKGLPPVQTDLEIEFQKAKDLLEKKFQHTSKPLKLDGKEKSRRMRFLAARGFSAEIIWKAMSSKSNINEEA